MSQALHQHISDECVRASPAPGAILLIASLLEVPAMLHHPSVQTSNTAQVVEKIAIGYACGVLVMTGAALVSGFMITELASLIPHSTSIELQINQQVQ